MDIIGMQTGGGGHPHHPSSPNTLEKGFYQILMRKIEMDGKDEQFFRRIQLRMKGSHRHASRGWGTLKNDFI